MELRSVEEWFKAIDDKDMERIMYNMSNFHRVTNNEGNTALILAAGRNEPEIVSLLAQLEYGMRNKHGYTALMAAAMYDSDECCRILLPLEQDLRLRDGGTAIMVAAAVGSVNAFNVLFPAMGDSIDTAGRGVLSVAASAGQLEIVKQILPPNGNYRTQKLPHDMRAAIQVATANRHDDVSSYLHQILTDNGTLDSTVNPLTSRMKSLRELSHSNPGLATMGYTMPSVTGTYNPNDLSLSTRGFQDTVQCEHDPDEICSHCLKKYNNLKSATPKPNITAQEDVANALTTPTRSLSQTRSGSRALSARSSSPHSILGTTRSGIGGGNYSNYDNYLHNTKSQLFQDHVASMRAASIRASSVERTSRASKVDTPSRIAQGEASRRSQVNRYPKSAKAAKMPFNSDFIAALQDNRIPDIQNESPYNPVKSKSRSSSNYSAHGTRSMGSTTASSLSTGPVGITTDVGKDSFPHVKSTYIDDLPGKKSYKHVASKVDSGIGNNMMPYDLRNASSYRTGTKSDLSPSVDTTTTHLSPETCDDEPPHDGNSLESNGYAHSTLLSSTIDPEKSAIPATKSVTSSSTKSSVYRDRTTSRSRSRSPTSPSLTRALAESTATSSIRASNVQSRVSRTKNQSLSASFSATNLTNWQQDQLTKSTIEASIRQRQANKSPYTPRSLRDVKSTGYTKSPTQGVTPPQFYVRPVNRFESDKTLVTIEQPYKDVVEDSSATDKDQQLNRLSRPRSVTKLVRRPLHMLKQESNLMDDLRKTLVKTLHDRSLEAKKSHVHSTTGPKIPGEALYDTLNRDPSMYATDVLSEERQYLDIPYTYEEGRRLLAQYPENPAYCQDEILDHKEPDLTISDTSTDLMRKLCAGEWSSQEQQDQTPTGKAKRKKGADMGTSKRISDLSEAGRQANDGSTALMFAAKYNNVDAVGKLLDSEGGLTMRSGHTALMIACIYGGLDAALMLAEKERCIQTRDKWTALMLCAKYNRYEVATELVPHECRLQNNMGNTALILAAYTGSLPFATLLSSYEKGIKNKVGRTALMTAVNFNHMEIVNLLIDAEAGAQDNEGTSALMIAAQQNKVDIVHLLAPREAKLRGSMQRTAMMIATRSACSRIVSELSDLESGLQDSDGWTALIIAALMNNISIVEILREKESGLHTNKGWTALMLASRCGYIEVVNLLVHKEAGIQMENGWCAIMSAAINGHTDIVKLLFPYEGHLKDNKGNTPMSIAFKRGYTELYNVLNELSLKKDAPWRPI
ncbi:Ankyrin repeat protein 1 [Giardia duodenalis]|uniref:Ankyrin repeat protein 1 n=1 Tax=Giardia intestinalis (strain ATCC 50803 / WB clone C6) TaxID=184922 RepID=A8B7P9_GIAIC|nr:Ankyrin repeat protein 1 [Giardia intestinalis]KAE8305413.1 Ankyrin repeat protein 1 [Giardia intestinalis]|eukprot:XP_001708855.1 Protein 21.1 [Giardia lamblia ATCC 50803]